MRDLTSNPAKLFEFAGSDCLYKDHHARRVLADVEGAGEYAMTASCPVQIFVDEVLVDALSGSFSQNLLVVSAEEGHAMISVGKHVEIGDIIESGGRFEGCGWLVGANGPVQLDGSHQDLLWNEARFPVPFFLGVSGEEFQIVPTERQAALVARFVIDDEQALKALQWKVQNISAISELDSALPDGTAYKGPIASHLNAASMTVAVPKGCTGLLLRKMYDRFHGRQRARVIVDGKFIGWWYQPEQDRKTRWAWSQFSFESDVLEGKDEIVLTIDPPAGAPLWSLGQMEIWAL